MPSKAPAGGFSHLAWNAARPSVEEIVAAWERHGPQANGVALLCGHGVELLDIDIQADPYKQVDRVFRDTMLAEFPEIFAKMVSETSISGGTHYWYLVGSNMPSTKLARLAYNDADRWALGDKYEKAEFGTIIETRGKGGYGICAPTNGYTITAGDITRLSLLTEEEREIVWQVARSFNTFVTQQSYIQNEQQAGSNRPGEDFSRKISVQDFCALFQEAGWKVVATRGDQVYLNRPGSKNSRKTDAVIVQSKKLFVNYSSSVPDFECEKGYSPYRAYALLRHRGDFRAAASALKKEGYGEQISYTPAPIGAQVADENKYEHLRFDLNNRPSVNFDLFAVSPPKTPYGSPEHYGIAFPGALIPVVGKQKSRKTTILTAIIASALKGQEVCGFLYNQSGPILWCDTEQPDLYFWMTQWRIVVQAEGMTDNLHAYRLRSLSTDERRKAIDYLVAKIKPSVIVIDGVADLIKSVNNEEECKAFTDEWLMPKAGNGTTVFPVLHLNKSDGAMSGWLGTVLGRKSDGTLQVEQVDDFSVEVSMRDARAERPPAFRLYTDRGMFGILYKDTKPAYNFNLGYKDEPLIKEAAATPYQADFPAPRDDEDIPF